MAAIADNLQVVRTRIAAAARAAGRDPQAVTLLAVSKTHAAARIAEAAAAGQRAFGENYVQEAAASMSGSTSCTSALASGVLAPKSAAESSA